MMKCTVEKIVRQFFVFAALFALVFALCACSGGTSYVGGGRTENPSGGDDSSYTVTFEANSADATGTIASVTGESVTLPAGGFAREGFSVFGWNTKADGSGTSYKMGSTVKLDGDMTLYAEWAHTFHDAVTILPSGTDGTAGTGATYALFGDFPQTIKSADVAVYEAKSMEMGAFTYYLGSDGYWYAKCKGNPHYDDDVYSNGAKIKGNTDYFKVEGIQWRVLAKNFNGTESTLLFCEPMLTGNIPYYVDLEERTIDGKTVHPNNYKYSTLRAYLNGSYEPSDVQAKTYSGTGFYQTAFTSAGQAHIVRTEVDNSLSSTGDTTNDYICENTSDFVFHLSRAEAETAAYGFKTDGNANDTARTKKATDFAKANHTYQPTDDAAAGGNYMLRTPGVGWNTDASAVIIANRVRRVHRYGRTNKYDDDVTELQMGIVPALCVK